MLECGLVWITGFCIPHTCALGTGMLCLMWMWHFLISAVKVYIVFLIAEIKEYNMSLSVDFRVWHFVCSLFGKILWCFQQGLCILLEVTWYLFCHCISYYWIVKCFVFILCGLSSVIHRCIVWIYLDSELFEIVRANYIFVGNY